MFNFSANHMVLLASMDWGKYQTFMMKDLDTQRSYKVFDFSKTHVFCKDKVYCISGKINSTEKLYLVLENFKEDSKYYQAAI